MELNKDIESQKKLASQWFKSLRDDFCKTFEKLDQKKFSRKSWNHTGEGGGETVSYTHLTLPTNREV